MDNAGSLIPVIQTLTCENAVDAALGVLPVDHPSVTAIEFHFGSYCPPRRGCPVAAPDWGFVVFQMSGGQDVWATVTSQNANVTATLEGPFPPA